MRIAAEEITCVNGNGFRVKRLDFTGCRIAFVEEMVLKGHGFTHRGTFSSKFAQSTVFFRSLFIPCIQPAKMKQALFTDECFSGASSTTISSFATSSTIVFLLITTSLLHAQTAPNLAPDVAPIAIVPLDSKNTDAAAKVTGALEVSQGKAIIVASGTVTSGSKTTDVVLPHRGTLRVCASTTVKLASDSSVPTGETPGLMIAMDHGAVEASFATGRNADILLTPDFRILIGALGAAEVKVRLGQHGDTCVDNGKAPSGTPASQPVPDAPYVLVSSVFDGGDYRVHPGQRVMFQHGSLKEVVDNEKEPCGCPPAETKGNEFPLAQSEGLAPLPAPSATNQTGTPAPLEPMIYKSADHTPQPAAEVPPHAPATPPPAKKPSIFHRLGSYFRRVFGAE